MKKVLVEMLQEAGFVAGGPDAYAEEAGIAYATLKKTYRRKVQVAWYGEHEARYDVMVFVNLDSGICRVDFFDQERPSKSRWYDTIGKRTYNAIKATVENAGYTF